MKPGYQVRYQQVVDPAGAGHGEHLALVVLALVLGLALDCQVLLGVRNVFG